ncbi:MAG TPA: 16S rRNA (guanine(527)-N(7))-methyltransferase RsmG [Gammaproteobacteria bacterium]|nr:16S rRNA (guanine(527)-N(7))-methyltransferase RsmG [Gammaproteobacteria bacterium]
MIDQARMLSKGLEALEIELSGQQQQLLLDYLSLLNKWNKAINLTAIRDPRQMVALQLLDSLAVLPFIRDAPLLDIGSGGGLPGIPIAIAQPQLDVTLLDSNGKKTRFLTQAKLTLQLQNVTVAQTRIEAWQPSIPPLSITCRAFSTLQQIIDWSQHLLTPQSEIIAMKGQYPHQELDEIADQDLNIVVHPVTIPGVSAERHIVCITGFHRIQRSAPTPERISALE